MCPLYAYHQSHPLNLILLGLFTVTMSLSVGIASSMAPGMLWPGSHGHICCLAAYSMCFFWCIDDGIDVLTLTLWLLLTAPIVLEALLLTTIVVVSLTGYTYWAAKRGMDFQFLGPALFTSLLVLIFFGFIQVTPTNFLSKELFYEWVLQYWTKSWVLWLSACFYVQMFMPLGSMSQTIYGGLSALIFSMYLVYDTDQLIKRYTYDQFILASVALYLDILNLFISILQILNSSRAE